MRTSTSISARKAGSKSCYNQLPQLQHKILSSKNGHSSKRAAVRSGAFGWFMAGERGLPPRQRSQAIVKRDGDRSCDEPLDETTNSVVARSFSSGMWRLSLRLCIWPHFPSGGTEKGRPHREV